MLTEFGKILAFLILAIVFVIVGILTAWLIRPKRPTEEKMMTYECGENTQGSPWVKFNFRFYIVALIFLIFDVEVVLLLPWVMVYKEFGLAGFAVGFVFIFMLVAGMVYEWRKGDLEWDRPASEKFMANTFALPKITIPPKTAKEEVTT